MSKDFYLNDRALSAYLEKDWADQFSVQFTFAPFDPIDLYSDYHERLIDFLVTELKKNEIAPKSMFEVGSALGRTYYECCRKIDSLSSATLVEPSENLSSSFNKIFSGEESKTFTILKGNIQTQEVSFNTKPIQAACARVQMQSICTPFQKLPAGMTPADLVVCSNVMDQCHNHLELIDLLKKATATGGVLLLSCTYQWQEKYIGNAVEQIQDINGLFGGGGWTFLNQTNIPFRVRVYERYWMTFLSHVVAYRRD